jgi:hypothetical protein
MVRDERRHHCRNNNSLISSRYLSKTKTSERVDHFFAVPGSAFLR